MTAAPVLMRPVRPNDATALVQLATLLDTMNLLLGGHAEPAQTQRAACHPA
jgi:hypothetical protein